MAETTSNGETETRDRRADYLLYRLSQHKYGWLYLTPSDREAAERLLERGWARYKRDNESKLEVTKAGVLRIRERWPLCPHLLEDYEPPLGGWTPFEENPHA